MASKSLKTTVISILAVLLFFLVGGEFILFMVGPRIYQERFVECDPNSLLPTLEWIFDVNFPEDIFELKTAKTPNLDRATLYVVRFTAEPNIVESFLGLFPSIGHSESYTRRYTFTSNGMPSPRWARRPIRQGKKQNISSIRGTSRVNGDIFINSTNSKKFVVYIEGLYPTDAEDRKETWGEDRKD